VRDTQGLVAALHEFYGPVHRPPAALFQFVVWELLSEHTAAARRDLAWNALRKIPALTPDAMFRAPAKDLADAMALCSGSREDLSTRLRNTVETFRRHRDRLDESRLRDAGPIAASRALRVLDQVSDAVRRRALLFALDVPVIPVDDDGSRVVCRLIEPRDLSTVARPSRRRLAHDRRRARAWLAARASDVDPRELLTYLRHHGRQTCTSLGPHCAVCPVAAVCRSRVPASA
jgi:endonuclease III